MRSDARASTWCRASWKPTAAPTPKRRSPTWKSCRDGKIDYRGVVLEEMDLDAILARRPQLCVVDELAHTNVPGSRHEKRYQDVSSCSTPASA